ncbi:MAG: response regulator [Acidobacteriota bacterium]|nr:response regulator [Acidobacteriota bacterium]
MTDREKAKDSPPAQENLSLTGVRTPMRQTTKRDANVLVVDDELVIREVLRDFLEAKGFRVASAASGSEALLWLQRNRPGVVLLDIFMPDGNGLEVLRELKRIQPGLSVLVISGYVDEELRQRVRALGAADCVAKPFDLYKLHAFISERIPSH